MNNESSEGLGTREERGQEGSHQGQMSRWQVEDLLSRDNTPPTRRSFLAAAVALGATAAAGAATLQPGGGPDAAGFRPDLTTRLTREYGVRHPFVGAGMGFIATPRLVAAVSNAGGIGVLGTATESSVGTQILIQQIKIATSKMFGVDFIVDDSALGPLTTDAHITACIAEQVKLVVFHMNVPPRAWVQELQSAGARVWMQAGSVKQALDAAALGVDAIIAQGVEAGGHNKSKTPAWLLLQEIRRAVRPIMVLAAGGIADGEGVFRALSSGADGVWVGTRLVASTEAYAHDEYKARLVAASYNASATTTMFGPEYPDRPYRVLRNRIVDEFAGREDRIPSPPPPPAVIGNTILSPAIDRVSWAMPKFSAIVPTPDTSGDFEEMGMPAGDGARLIKKVHPAADIIETMIHDARMLFERRLASLPKDLGLAPAAVA